MAAPTVTWYPVINNAGSPAFQGAITELDFGSAQAGYWSDVKCVVANFAGNSVHTFKFWLVDTDGGGVDVSQSAGWNHMMFINSTFIDPDSFNNNQKAGAAGYPAYGERFFVRVPESEPPSDPPQFVTNSKSSGQNTDFIYLCLQSPGDAQDGWINDWGYRLSFLYP